MEIVNMLVKRNNIDNKTSVKNNEKLTLLEFVSRQCRKYCLISDSISLLNFTDYLQVLQLCFKKVYEKVSIDLSTLIKAAYNICAHMVCKALENIVLDCLENDHINVDDKIISNRKSWFCCNKDNGVLHCIPGDIAYTHVLSEENKAIYTEYLLFMKNCNLMDAVNVFRIFLIDLVKHHRGLDCQLPSNIFDYQIVALTSANDGLQECIIKLLCCKTSYNQLADILLSGFQTNYAYYVPTIATSRWCELCRSVDKSTMVGNNENLVDIKVVIVQEIFQSYLKLLVNTRNELALAHIFNTPHRALTHESFTHLKYEAQERKISLYQMALSVIGQLRLGGQGYAPDPNRKLMAHIKGLGQLIDLTSSLQEVLDDLKCIRSSVLRVPTIIKKSIIGCQSGRYKAATVNVVWSKIHSDLGQVVEDMLPGSYAISPGKPACQGGSLTSRRTHRVLLRYLDNCAASSWEGPSLPSHCTWLADIPFGPNTPSRFPCALSQFTSPVSGVALDVPKNHTKPAQRKRVSPNGRQESRIVQPDNNSKPPDCKAVRKNVASGEDRNGESVRIADLDEKENHAVTKLVSVDSVRKITECSERLIPVEPPGRNNNVLNLPSDSVRRRKGKTCRRKLLAQISGQQTITHFFSGDS